MARPEACEAETIQTAVGLSGVVPVITDTTACLTLGLVTNPSTTTARSRSSISSLYFSQQLSEHRHHLTEQNITARLQTRRWLAL